MHRWSVRRRRRVSRSPLPLLNVLIVFSHRLRAISRLTASRLQHLYSVYLRRTIIERRSHREQLVADEREEGGRSGRAAGGNANTGERARVPTKRHKTSSYQKGEDDDGKIAACRQSSFARLPLRLLLLTTTDFSHLSRRAHRLCVAQFVVDVFSHSLFLFVSSRTHMYVNGRNLTV